MRVTAGFLYLVLLLTSCQVVRNPAHGPRPPAFRRPGIVKPVVAVMAFENKSNFSGQWHLGDGMADLLTSKLLDSERFTVLERRHLDDVLGEIIRQGKEFFRPEGRVERGRLKNARYLFRGVITDFTVTGDASGWFGVRKAAGLFGGGSKARVAINLYVSDVESGEILSSVTTSASARKGFFGTEVNYKSLSFGGDAYFRTPLGKATEKAMSRAVREILEDLPVRTWKPSVADASTDLVVINGGQNVRVRAGDEFLVRETGRDVTDPLTGNVIDRFPGRVVGRIRVTDVRPRSSHAIIVWGVARRGDMLDLPREDETTTP